MKLAFCLFKYFPYGGLQRDFLRIARECQQRGHEIHVYTSSWQGASEPDFNIHIMHVNNWTNHGSNYTFAEKVKVALDKEHYDLVIGFNRMPNLDIYYAADVCYQARVKNQRGLFYRLLPRYRQLLAFERAVFAKGQKTEIMAISPVQQDEFIKYYQTEKSRFHLLPPGIAKDRIAPPNAAEIRLSLRKSYQLTNDDIMLLMVGSGFRTKGLDRSIRALASLPTDLKERTQLFVIGQDNPAKFIRLAKSLHIDHRIHFLGGRNDVPEFLLAADLLLHPSYHENTGTALLEALVAGLPVLTVDVCGYAHYVATAKAGEVVSSPFQQSKFNATLEKMLLSPERQQWRQNALDFARNTDIYSMAQKAADLIENQGAKDNEWIKALTFDEIMSLRGEHFRNKEGRLTQRILKDGKSYFLKQHTGVGWKEIFKNLLQLRWPIISAQNEWRAISKLQSLGILTANIVAYGKRGINPARLHSYVLMEELTPTISLEDLCRTWQKRPPSIALKRRLIDEVACIARTLHENGINHRDFYGCHFLLDTSKGVENIDANNLKLYLIDLHRAQIRRLTPARWIIKDLAGLYYSCKDIGLTQRDMYRFMKLYQQKSLRDIFENKTDIWQKVRRRGEELYRDHKD